MLKWIYLIDVAFVRIPFYETFGVSGIFMCACYANDNVMTIKEKPGYYMFQCLGNSMPKFCQLIKKLI